MDYTKEKVIYGTTCPSCGTFTPDNLATNPKEAQKRRAAPNMFQALVEMESYLENRHPESTTQLAIVRQALAKAVVKC